MIIFVWFFFYLFSVGHGFSINPFDTRSVSARVFGSLTDLNEFIGDDEGFYYLREHTEVLDAGKDPQMEAGLQMMISHYDEPEVRQELEDMSWQSLDVELEILNDKLETIYQRLLEFSKILVSLTDEDFFEMGDKLLANKEYYDKIMRDEVDPLSFFQDWVQTRSADDDDLITVMSIDQMEVLEDVVIAEDGVKYWDPDASYEMIEKYMVKETAETKLEELFEATGILKLIKKTIKKIKLFFSLLLKLFKLAKVLKLKEIKTCLKIMKTIEKIKKCLMLIKSVLIKKIKKFIKGFPFNILYKIKMVILLILKIIKKILWEIKYIIMELLIKLYYFLKKLKRVPIVLKIYIKQEIYERLGGEDHDQQEAWDDFGEWDDQVNEEWREYNDIETVYDGGLQYAIGSGHKPKELDMLFKKSFTAQEYSELERDDFNHEVIYAFEDIEDPILEKRDIFEHTLNYETLDNETFNVTVPNFNMSLGSDFLEKLKDINVVVIHENKTDQVFKEPAAESSSGTINYGYWLMYALPGLWVFFTQVLN